MRIKVMFMNFLLIFGVCPEFVSSESSSIVDIYTICFLDALCWQKYRLGKQSFKESTENSKDGTNFLLVLGSFLCSIAYLLHFME